MGRLMDNGMELYIAELGTNSNRFCYIHSRANHFVKGAKKRILSPSRYWLISRICIIKLLLYPTK